MSVIFLGILLIPDTFIAIATHGKSKLVVLGPLVLWLIMQTSFTSITQGIIGDSTLGTLEQLYISSGGYCKIIFLKALSSFILNMIPTFSIICIISLIIKTNLLGFLIGLPIIILGIPSIWGFSLIAGAFILAFKQVSMIVTIFSVIFFSGISYLSLKNMDSIFFHILPFGTSNKVSLSIIQNINYDFGIFDMIMIIANSTVYLVIGIMCFKFAENYAKKHGKLGMH
ncbi:MAG: hypothetical protein LBP85_03200 [Prevotellaceae bacterium]|nr:hypothetical protein [Prevotellaceae bacterium]